MRMACGVVDAKFIWAALVFLTSSRTTNSQFYTIMLLISWIRKKCVYSTLGCYNQYSLQFFITCTCYNVPDRCPITFNLTGIRVPKSQMRRIADRAHSRVDGQSRPPVRVKDRIANFYKPASDEWLESLHSINSAGTGRQLLVTFIGRLFWVCSAFHVCRGKLLGMPRVS